MSATLRVFLVVERPIYASTACVRASSPVEAVINGGSERVTSGSSTAYLGISGKSLIGYLTRVFASVMTAARVVSLPVPAVVGTAKSGGSGRITFKMPFILISGVLGRAMQAPTALAQSIEEPPPKPIRAWQLFSLYKCRASSTLSVVGLATVPSYTVQKILFCSISCSRWLVSPRLRIPLSVTRRTWLSLRDFSLSMSSSIP